MQLFTQPKREVWSFEVWRICLVLAMVALVVSAQDGHGDSDEAKNDETNPSSSSPDATESNPGGFYNAVSSYFSSYLSGSSIAAEPCVVVSDAEQEKLNAKEEASAMLTQISNTAARLEKKQKKKHAPKGVLERISDVGSRIKARLSELPSMLSSSDFDSNSSFCAESAKQLQEIAQRINSKEDGDATLEGGDEKNNDDDDDDENNIDGLEGDDSLKVLKDLMEDPTVDASTRHAYPNTEHGNANNSSASVPDNDSMEQARAAKMRKIGIGVGIGVGIVAFIIVLGTIIVVRRRRTTKHSNTGSQNVQFLMHDTHQANDLTYSEA